MVLKKTREKQQKPLNNTPKATQNSIRRKKQAGKIK